MDRSQIEKLAHIIIGCAIDVHKILGPGLLESAYGQALAYELSQRNLSFKKEVAIPIVYKGTNIESAFRADIIVEDAIIIELKSVELILHVHGAQLLTYLKFADKKLGLLINFNVKLLKDGISRIVNNL